MICMLKKPSIYFLPLLLIVVQNVYAQEQPPAYPAGSQASYIRVWQATGPDVNISNFNASTGLQKAIVTTSYFDGLGRTLQSVIKQGSLATGSAATDFISP